MEVLGGHQGAQIPHAANPVKTDHGERHCTRDQDESLHRVGIDDRRQSSGDGVNARGDDEDDRGFHQRPARDALQHDAGSIELHRNLGENVSDDRDGRQVNRALPVKTPLEKFRHGEDIRAQVKGHEHPSQDKKHDAGQPFEMADREAGGGASSRKPDEMFGRNVGDK